MADRTECVYDEMNALTTRLSSEAEAVSQLRQQTSSKVEDLHGKGWVGQGADAFFQEMETLVLPSLARLAEALQQASAASSEIVGIYRQAESEAKDSFSTLPG